MKYILSIAILICALSSQGQIRQQYVIASIGGTTQTGLGGTTFTVGELSMIKTFSSGANTLTQGFLQGYIPPTAGHSGALPVKLISFSGFYKEGSDHLDWLTGSELNNDHFDIERMNKKGDFVLIGTVKGHGTTGEEHSYAFDDQSPMPGENYYRLKQVDIDGHFAYSDIISIEAPVTSAMTVSIYPNPAKNYVNVLFASSDAHVGTLVMTNMMGEVVYQSSLLLSSGTNQSTIDMSAFSQGQYVVKFTSSDATTTTRIVKE